MKDETEFKLDFGEVINVGGGTSDFDALSNRPKYNNETMTGETNIPEVPTKTSDLENDSDYQTGDEVESAISTAIADKQDTLTAGENITIENDTISATDTTYTAGANVNISSENVISATDTTYTHFTGATASADGTQGLVPAPIAGDEDKFLKADGTWDTAGGSGPTVVQTTGTSTTDVMSQNATTSMVFADPADRRQVQIADEALTVGFYGVSVGFKTNARANGVAIGNQAKAGTSAAHNSPIAIGVTASAGATGAISLGSYSSATHQGEMNIGTSQTSHGYNNTNYRLISGVHDPVNDHDAATKGYVDAQAGGGGSANCKELTAADYNYDSNNDGVNDTVALWLLDPGLYWWDFSFGDGGGISFVPSTSGILSNINFRNYSNQAIIGWLGDKTTGFITIRAFARSPLVSSSTYGWAPFVPYVVNKNTSSVVNFQTDAIPVGRGDLSS